ncbi:MAG: hypothetical protein H0V98_05985, partial [Chloroflexia bacterium]|nr:hypothetical protein [Chloroflexia bacterium]
MSALLLVALGMMLASFAGVANVAAQDEDMPTVTIGSKDFTESIVLAEMAALLLEDAGYDVERQLNLGGTVVAHEALVNGNIDIYVEYTGTGLLAILGMDLPTAGATPAAATPATGATPAAATLATGATPAAATPPTGATPVATGGMDEVYMIVSAEYEEQFGLQWLE